MIFYLNSQSIYLYTIRTNAIEYGSNYIKAAKTVLQLASESVHEPEHALVFQVHKAQHQTHPVAKGMVYLYR